MTIQERELVRASRLLTAGQQSPALQNEILRGVVGSTAHGTGEDGQEDRDEIGIFVEPPEYVMGLKKCDHFIYRDQPNGERSQPGDLDLTLYSLRKFCRLARQGNPSVLLLLYLPEYRSIDTVGAELVSIRSLFYSRRAGERFLGYLVSQRRALTGERAKKVQRPELVARHGFDTKFAMHALRLGWQGIEYLTTKNVEIPVREPERAILRAVRGGGVPYDEVLQLIASAELELRAAIDSCAVARPDTEAIDRFLVKAHNEYWMRTRMI